MKAIVTLALLVISGTTFAGGLGIENVQQHMNANDWVSTQADQQRIISQGSIEKFESYTQDETMVDTNKLRHSYQGKDDVLAGRPNFIRYLRRNA